MGAMDGSMFSAGPRHMEWPRRALNIRHVIKYVYSGRREREKARERERDLCVCMCACACIAWPKHVKEDDRQ